MSVEYGSTSCYRLFLGTGAKPIIRLARRQWKNVDAGNNGSRSEGISKREVIPFIVVQTSNCQRVEQLRVRIQPCRIGYIVRLFEKANSVTLGRCLFICLFAYTFDQTKTNLFFRLFVILLFFSLYSFPLFLFFFLLLLLLFRASFRCRSNHCSQISPSFPS